MKTRITSIIFGMSLLMTATALAFEPERSSRTVSQSVARWIQGALEYPDFAKHYAINCLVALRLVIQTDGTLFVLEANCPNWEIRDDIVDQVESLQDENYARYAGQEVLVKINLFFLG